jgi:signal peptide peptidase SppA
MSYPYHRYVSQITRRPWAILESKAIVIRELLLERIGGHRPSANEIRERLGHGAVERPATSGSRVVVVPIHGTIAHRADAFELSSGGTSTEWLSAVMKRLTADESVRAIVLDIDSPGGSTEGMLTASDAIFAARQAKPVVAVANSMAASAAYWLASQAHEIVVEPSGSVGSVGVLMITVDMTDHLAKEGYKVEVIKFGSNKIEGNPYEPMSDETRAHFKAEVEAIGAQFHAHIARGREVSVEQVATTYGDGRMFLAEDAKARGMVDKIATLDDTIARLMKSTRVLRRAATAADDVPMLEEAVPHGSGAMAAALALELELEAL